MKRYFAWVFFVIGAINTLAAAMKYASGTLPTLADWPAGTASVVLFLPFVPFCLYLWWRWK